MEHYIKILFIIITVMSLAICDDLGELTNKLDGTTISYSYSGGRAYNLKIETEGISYQYLTGPKPERWWGPFPYKAIEVEKNVYFMSWYEDGYGDYVTLLINFDKNILYGSAIIPNKGTHFQNAKINNIKR